MRNDSMITPKCIAVIGGCDHEGEYFRTLRLFDCQSTADAYVVELEREFDYVLVEVKEISQYSMMMGVTIG
jgi:hypothetical protein